MACPALLDPTDFGVLSMGDRRAALNYASKRIYLASSIFDTILSCAVLVSAFVLPQGRRIFALLIGGALFYLSGFFLPLVV
jgi:hypothetical protein